MSADLSKEVDKCSMCGGRVCLRCRKNADLCSAGHCFGCCLRSGLPCEREIEKEETMTKKANPNTIWSVVDDKVNALTERVEDLEAAQDSRMKALTERVEDLEAAQDGGEKKEHGDWLENLTERVEQLETRQSEDPLRVGYLRAELEGLKSGNKENTELREQVNVLKIRNQEFAQQSIQYLAQAQAREEEVRELVVFYRNKDLAAESADADESTRAKLTIAAAEREYLNWCRQQAADEWQKAAERAADRLGIPYDQFEVPR